MPTFLDLARELRDMVYVAALGTEYILFAKNEIDPDFVHEQVYSSIPLALLQVNKQVNAEAIEIFLARKTFRASLCPALGRNSVFATHARLFRNIILKLAYPAYLLDGEYHLFNNSEGSMYEGKNDDGMIGMWKQQMRTLGSMINLKFVQLEVTNLGIMVHPGDVRKNIPTWTLLRELLTGLPQDVRKIEGLEERDARDGRGL